MGGARGRGLAGRQGNKAAVPRRPFSYCPHSALSGPVPPPPPPLQPPPPPPPRRRAAVVIVVVVAAPPLLLSSSSSGVCVCVCECAAEIAAGRQVVGVLSIDRSRRVARDPPPVRRTRRRRRRHEVGATAAAGAAALVADGVALGPAPPGRVGRLAGRRRRRR